MHPDPGRSESDTQPPAPQGEPVSTQPPPGASFGPGAYEFVPNEPERPNYVVEQQTWGLPDAALGLILGIVFVSIAAAAVIAGGSELDDLPMWGFALVNGTLHLGLLVGAIFAGTKGFGWIRDWRFSMKAGDVPLGLALGFGCQIAVGLMYLPFFELFDVDSEEVGEPARELSARADSAVGEIALIILVGLVAPFVEEIFFRGVLFRAIDKKLMRQSTGRWMAIGASAFVFAGYHFQLLQFPALLFVGLVLAYMVHKTGNLGLAIWTHVGFNMTTVVSLLYL